MKRSRLFMVLATLSAGDHGGWLWVHTTAAALRGRTRCRQGIAASGPGCAPPPAPPPATMARLLTKRPQIVFLGNLCSTIRCKFADRLV